MRFRELAVLPCSWCGARGVSIRGGQWHSGRHSARSAHLSQQWPPTRCGPAAPSGSAEAALGGCLNTAEPAGADWACRGSRARMETVVASPADGEAARREAHGAALRRARLPEHAVHREAWRQQAKGGGWLHDEVLRGEHTHGLRAGAGQDLTIGRAQCPRVEPAAGLADRGLQPSGRRQRHRPTGTDGPS